MNKNLILLFTGILFYVSVSAQQVMDSVILTSFSIKWVDRQAAFLCKYADSINNYTSGAIPVFLLDECFDFHHHELWDGLHGPVCARAVILGKVNNKRALKIILKDERLKLRCTLPPYGGYVGEVPLKELSTYDLIKKRIKELLIKND